MIALKHVPKIDFLTPTISEPKPALERYLLYLASAVVVAVLICLAVRSVSAGSVPAPGIIHVTVRPGDSIWNYARKYGNPNTYILKRVHQIAAMNRVSPRSPLVPGQVLVVPVERLRADSWQSVASHHASQSTHHRSRATP